MCLLPQLQLFGVIFYFVEEVVFGFVSVLVFFFFLKKESNDYMGQKDEAVNSIRSVLTEK